MESDLSHCSIALTKKAWPLSRVATRVWGNPNSKALCQQLTFWVTARRHCRLCFSLPLQFGPIITSFYRGGDCDLARVMVI